MSRPSREIDVPRLVQAMAASRTALEKPREEMTRMVERYAGAHWGPKGRTMKDDPINLIGEYVSIIGRTLISRAPRVMLSTFEQKQTAAVAAMQDWLNAEAEKSDLANTLQRCVLEALFCMGIAKVGLATPSDAAVASWSLKAGYPFCAPVSFDDFVFDIHARDFREAAFKGHRYRVPLDTIKDSKLYTKARNKLEASADKSFNESGDERIGTLGRGWVSGDDTEYEKMVDLWEVYLPRDKVILTLADDYLTGASDSTDGEELRRQNWVGPECGPYHILGYGMVPGNAMPKAPVQDLYYLHQAVNRAVRKAVRSIDDLKEFTAVRGQADADGSRLVQVNSGDVVRFDDPEGMRQIVSGGQVIQSAVGMATFCDQLFNKIAGNMDLMGGRSSQAKTAHQEELLQQNSAAGIIDLQDATLQWVNSVFKSWCWYNWNHPTAVHKAKYSAPGIPELASVRELHPYDPEAENHQELVGRNALMRKGEMPQVTVDAYSMGHATPESRVADLDQFMTNIFIPLAPLMAQQGIMPDLHNYLKKRAHYRNMPDLPEILQMTEPPAPEGATATDGQDQPRMPAATNRTYTRKSVSEKTPEGQGASLVNNLLSGKSVGGSQSNGKMPGVTR